MFGSCCLEVKTLACHARFPRIQIKVIFRLLPAEPPMSQPCMIASGGVYSRKDYTGNVRRVDWPRVEPTYL